MNSSKTKQGLKTFIITSVVTLAVIFSLNGISSYLGQKPISEKGGDTAKIEKTKITSIHNLKPARSSKISYKESAFNDRPPRNVFSDLNKSGIVLSEVTESATPSGEEATTGAVPDTGSSIHSISIVFLSITALFAGFVLLEKMPFRKRLIEKFEEDIINNRS